MRYLVTGGLGYLGSWVTIHLAGQGHEVFVLSRSEDKPDLGVPYTLVSADVAHASMADLAARLPEYLDGCVHAASHTDAFVPDYAARALAVNGLGTRNILAALVEKAGKSKAELPLFLYLSTFHVYGALAGRINEQTPPAPRNDYGLTHLVGEEYCRLFGRAHGFPVIAVRPTNGYGAPKSAPCGKWYLLLNDLCRMAFEKGEAEVRSNPAIRRDFVWLGDVAEVLSRLLARRDLAGRVFNISSGQTVSLEEVARAVARAGEKRLGKAVALRLAETPTEKPPLLHVDNSALLAALGEPSFAFHNALEQEAENLFTFLARYGAS